MKFNWDTYKKPVIVLSPMAGYTDSAYKQIVRGLASEAVLVTEFVSSDAVSHGSERTGRMMRFTEKEHPVILQIFGNTPERFVETAKLAQKIGYDGVDINMGCPAKKIIRSEHGSALIKIENQETAFKIVSDVAKAVKIPVSVKTRLGWQNADGLIPFCKKLEAHGCSSVCVHGRTTKQGYSGQADWKPIYELKKKLKIPVFGNGDIVSISSFRAKLGNLDGVFIGRAMIGDPWLLGDIEEYLKNKAEYDQLDDSSLELRFPRGENIPWDKKLPVILNHLKLSVQSKGEEFGVLEMRKHLAAYIKGLPGARALRVKLMKSSSSEELELLLRGITPPLRHTAAHQSSTNSSAWPAFFHSSDYLF